MKTLFFVIFIFIANAVHAQMISTWTQGVIPLPATPAVCNPGNGQVVFNTATNGLLSCTGLNQWRPAGATGNQFTFAQGVITASAPWLNHTATWNAGAVTFIDMLSNVTDTASAAASLFVSFQLNGIPQFTIDKTGNTSTAGYFMAGPTTTIGWNSRSQMRSGADGRINFTDVAGTGLSTLTLGPESNAFIRITPISVGGVGQGIQILHGDGTTAVFADLGAAANGTIIYCSDCTKATPCAALGNGAIAKRLNGAWDCD